MCTTINALELKNLSVAHVSRFVPGHYRRVNLRLNYPYFSIADEPFADADVADVSLGKRLSSRFPIAFYHRLANHKCLATVDPLTKIRYLRFLLTDLAMALDTSV